MTDDMRKLAAEVLRLIDEQPIGATEGKAYALAVLADPAVESAPAADAGIVALTGEVASVIMGTAEVEDEDGRSWELPKWPTAHFGQRIEVLVRVLDAEHAARRGGAR